MLLPAAVRRAQFNSRRSGSDDATLDESGAGSDEAKDCRGGAAGFSAGASCANFQRAASSSEGGSMREHAHSSRALESAFRGLTS